MALGPLSLTGRAERRAEMARRAIEGLLADGNPKKAFNEAIGKLQTEAKALNDHRPADGALTYAQLAAYLASLAAGLHAHRPDRPPGCPKAPGPDDLLAAFTAIYDPPEE